MNFRKHPGLAAPFATSVGWRWAEHVLPGPKGPRAQSTGLQRLPGTHVVPPPGLAWRVPDSVDSGP